MRMNRGTGTDRVGAVVIGGYVNGLGVVRGLAARGVRVAVVATKPFDIAQYSRRAAERRYLPGLHEAPGELPELLDRESGRWGGAAIFPTNDHAVEVLAQEHEHLSRAYRLTTPPWDAIRPLLRKDETYRLAESLGIPIPRGYGSSSPQIAEDVTIRYPVVVKPLESHVFAERFDRKLFVASDARELATACDRVAAAGIEAQVLDLVPGGDDCAYAYFVYLGSKGEPVAGVTIRKIRQSPPFFGVSRVAEVIPDRDDVREPAIALLRAAGFRGMADVQFKLDPRDGTMRLMDVNTRAVVYNSLATRVGCNLPHMAWTDAVLGERAPQPRNGWDGVWIHLHADLLNSVFLHRQERLRLGDYLSPYRRRKTFADWSARDPRPFATQWARTARDASRLIASGRIRDELRARRGPVGSTGR